MARKRARVAMRTRSSGARFIVLTGLSGSGKSQAIRALEDLGYFCIDNLPTTLIPTLAELTQRVGGDLQKVAIVVDVREGSFLLRFPKVFRKLRAMPGLKPALIFLEASDTALVRRFSETRRPHPLARNRSASEGIREERERLNAIRGMADEIVDTTDLTVHELRQIFKSWSQGKVEARPLVVTFLSFGYKHGVPLESDLLFDARFLPNPYFVARLRNLTGRDAAVVRYMRQHEATTEFVDRVTDFLAFAIPQYRGEGKSYLTVAIGCTGGRHRSVMISEVLRRNLAHLPGVRVRVRHRDMHLGT